MLTAGPETDRAVAKACGLRLDAYEGTGNYSTPPLWYDRKPWSPSTDLNDSFMAAEKVGLFVYEQDNNTCLCVGWQFPESPWEVWKMAYELEKRLSHESTPALAICAAILKLAAEKANAPG